MRKSKAVSAIEARLKVRQGAKLAAPELAKRWFVLFFTCLLFAGAATQSSFAQSNNENVAIESAAAQLAPTTTELSVLTDDSGPATRAKFTVRVNAEQGSAAGVVTLSDLHGPLGSAAVDAEGIATFDIDALRPGANRIVATYAGSGSQGPSTSPAVDVNALASGIPDYTFALSPTALTVKAGTDGTILATITPTNGFNQLVSLSCAGNGVPLPVGVTCLFTPVNLVPAASGAALTSSLNLQTTGVAGKTLLEPQRWTEVHPAHPVYALLFPGMAALAALVGARKRRWGAVRRLSLVTLLAVSALGLSSCAARYHYLHNPPAANNGTPLGTYTLVITASSSSNSSITVHSQNIALTVN